MAMGLAVIGVLAAACGPGPPGGGTTATPSAAPVDATGDCDSVTACYPPRQLQVAYGIRPLLARGIDGRGQTVVLPELAESQLSPPLVSNLRQDMALFDRLFHLPATRLRVVATFQGRSHRGSSTARRCWTPKWCTQSLPAPPSPSSW